MKNVFLSLLLSTGVLFSGCASTGGLSAPATKGIARIAVTYAVAKVTEKHPEKAAAILKIAHDIRGVAGTDGFNTVDLLIDAIRIRANLTSLSPADQALANILIDTLGEQLKAKIGNGTLTTDKLLIVGEVAGWVEDAAKVVQPPA